jgi:hypothetical protein
MTLIFGSGSVDISAMGRGLHHLDWLIAGTMLVLTMPLMGAARWRGLLFVQGIELTYVQSLRLILVGFFFNTCLPGATGGDLFRAFAIRKQSAKTAEAVTTVVIDRLSGLIGLIVMCFIALFLNIEFISANKPMQTLSWVMVGLLFGGGITVCLLMSRKLLQMFRASFLWAINFPGRSVLARAVRALHAYHGSRMTLVWALVISLFSHLATIAAAYCFGQALGITELDLFKYLLIVPMGLAFNSIPITPGGIGQGQAAFLYLFTIALPGRNDAGSLGAALMTFIHISMFFLSIIGSVLYAMGHHQFHDAFVEAEEEEEREEKEVSEELSSVQYSSLGTEASDG